MSASCRLLELGMINALGKTKSTILTNLLTGSRDGLVRKKTAQGEFTVAEAAPASPRRLEYIFDNRLNRLLAVACDQIRAPLEKLSARHGTRRIGVVIGSTDNGSEQSLEALEVFDKTGAWPPDYRYFKQSAHHSSAFVKHYLGLEGPAVNISTACTSSARAFVHARGLLALGVCDAVIAGGADIVSDSVLYGFHSLEAVDREPCNPFSRNRKGINLGEGAALFILTRDADADGVDLLGCGESSDAYHMTAPEPEGTGAAAAMQAALADAGLDPDDIDYLNLHGTGTDLNDRMESKATHRVFPHDPPASGTKTMVGHTLGAAGAMELGFCWLLLQSGGPGLPPHLWDNEPEENIPRLNFVERGGRAKKMDTCMSNSYAFGGSNVSLIIGRGRAS